MVHGLAKFQAGCRCQECCASESARLRQIARIERDKWGPTNRDAMTGWGEKHHRSPAPTKNGMPWTRPDIIVALDYSISIREAAKRLGRTVAAVKNVRRRKRA
ncbi:Uncharacterised protein [Mycobacteroides abscessus subsp. massiliense]|nr:Uncharacterised protein [Mycobacteroides abscessus subsp. massiliense]SKU18898.1 Uncharacterised protein [Mycobacteroides abscessus subsp. massiliense]